MRVEIPKVNSDAAIERASKPTASSLLPARHAGHAGDTPLFWYCFRSRFPFGSNPRVVVRTALWADHCDGLRSAIYVVGHLGRGALGTARPEHAARFKNACLDWDWLFGVAANCGFHGRLLATGRQPKRTIGSAPNRQGNIYVVLLVLFAIMPSAANWWLERFKLRGHVR
jgi:hypothetical protein